jgi:hypothetical protein
MSGLRLKSRSLGEIFQRGRLRNHGEAAMPCARSDVLAGTSDALKHAVRVALLISAAAIYWFALRRLFVQWGSTPSDRAQRMSGDASILAATYTATLAVTVAAAPECIWPWLVQIGYRRGGLYSYDWLDRLFGYLDRPSADRILPEFQRLVVGDEIPIGRGGGFPVTSINPGRELVLSGGGDGFQWVWEFGLYPIDATRTRLVSRNIVRVPPTVGSWILMRVIEPAAFLMTRRMLLGIRQRAERLRGKP